MDGHKWKEVGESEVLMGTPGQYKSKKQKLWTCSRCKSSTIINDGLSPESVTQLYHIEPLVLDGTTIMDPPIMDCDTEMAKAK